MLNDIYQGLDPIAFSLGPLVVRWYGPVSYTHLCPGSRTS